jgi:hypothetical protein
MTLTRLLRHPGIADGPAADRNPSEEPPPAGALGGAGAAASPLRQRYLAVLTGLFTLFNTVRVVAYLPTLWAIVQSGDSSQHSLWTWFTWAGANLTMAAWLYEQQGQRWSRAMAVNLANAAMCTATFVVIAALRI